MLGQNGGDVAGAVAYHQDECGREQCDVASARDDPFLLRRALRFHPLGVEEQKLVQEEAGRDPGQHKLHQRAGLHQQQHRGERQQHPAGERALLGLAVQIGAGKAQHDPADETRPEAS
jgi:hypothetical protein